MSPKNWFPLKFTLLCIGVLFLSLSAYAADKEKEEEKKEGPAYDFEHEETFMDVPDALRSRQFVHRAILSTIIRDTAKVQLGSFYVNNLMGFAAVYQPSKLTGASFAKYVTGVLGFAGGYSTLGGHTIELGIDLSANSMLVLSYRKFFGSQEGTFWPYLGLGVGTEFGMRLTDLPVEAQVYMGSTSAGFFTVGMLIPLVDIALKAEARFQFFGMDRWMLTTGAGVVFFL